MDTKTVSKMDKIGLKWMEWMGKCLKNRRETITMASYTAAGR